MGLGAGLEAMHVAPRLGICQGQFAQFSLVGGNRRIDPRE